MATFLIRIEDPGPPKRVAIELVTATTLAEAKRRVTDRGFIAGAGREIADTDLSTTLQSFNFFGSGASFTRPEVATAVQEPIRPSPTAPSPEAVGEAGPQATFGEFLTGRGFGTAREPSRARTIAQGSFNPLLSAFALGERFFPDLGEQSGRFQSFLGGLPSLDPRGALGDVFRQLSGTNVSGLPTQDPLRLGLAGQFETQGGDVVGSEIANAARQLVLSNISPLVARPGDLPSSTALRSQFIQGQRTGLPGNFEEFLNQQLGTGRFF